ncbi:hypothetical protein OAA41_00410 [bacterium]|nr:hypothetical protein [bacterium]
MFSFDRETAILAAVVVCVAASLYMYNELRQSKDDITKIKTFLDRVQEEAQEVQMPQMVYAPVTEEMPNPESEPESEPEPVVVQEPPKVKRATRGKSPVSVSPE